MLESVLVNERGQPVPRPVRHVAVLAVALVVPGAILTIAGPGHSPRGAAWPTAGLAVLAAAWLTGVLAVYPRQAGRGGRQMGRPWRVPQAVSEHARRRIDMREKKMLISAMSGVSRGMSRRTGRLG